MQLPRNKYFCCTVYSKEEEDFDEVRETICEKVDFLLALKTRESVT